MSEYSIALEKQLELLRFYEHPERRAYAARVMRDDVQLDGKERQWMSQNTHELLLHSLRRGEAYYWAESTCRLIDFAAESLPNWTMPSGVLPQAGFFWFSRPLSLPEWVSPENGDHEDAPFCALSWVTDAKMIAFSAWHLFKDHGPPGTPLGYAWPTPDSYIFWPYGDDLSTIQSRTGAQGNFTDGELALSASVLRYIASAIAFIDQKLVTATRQEPARATRRRAAALAHDPLLRVVELRRKEHVPSDHVGDSEHRDWSCQWMVRGHWRQQWYPKLNRHQPKWITPYVKGPEDKPLKEPRATVFAVVR